MIVTQNGPQNIDQVKTYFECGNLFLSPEEYQRENAWRPAQKQLLIDTIFRGLDIPKFYFWKIDQGTLADGYPDGEAKELYRQLLEHKRRENDDPNPYVFEAVDGQQRIRTILEFMGVKPPNEHCYRGAWHEPYTSLDETPMARGKRYDQLNAEQRISFGQCLLTVMILERATIDEVRDMFLRLQNGTPLNAQQKRDAAGSQVTLHARELASLLFFTNAVNFDNTAGDHHRIISQMLHLESRDRIVTCTSRQLDKFYAKHKTTDLDKSIASWTKKVVRILGAIFPQRNPALNRSYALGLYWTISRVLKTCRIDESQYPKLLENFEHLDQRRLEAMSRDYSNENDDTYEELSQSMSRGTDGSERISTRYEILTQFIFDGVNLDVRPDLDSKRDFTNEEKLILYRRAIGRCQLGSGSKMCGRALDFDEAVVDHIVPHSKGGRTSLENGRIAYKSCNIARGARDDFDPHTMCCRLREDN